MSAKNGLDSFRNGEDRALIFSKKAAKSLQICKVSHKKGHSKILEALELLTKYDFPPLFEVKKMHWQIHGQLAYCMRVKSHPEYRITYQAQDKVVFIDDIMTREQFEKITRGR